MRQTTFFIILSTLLTVTSCTAGYDTKQILEETQNKGLTAVDIEFNDDYSKITVSIDQTRDFGYDLLDTSQVRVSVAEMDWLLQPRVERVQPTISDIMDVGSKRLRDNHLNLFVMVDMTSSPERLSQYEKYIRRMYASFCYGNMFISFMLPRGEVSEVMEVTPYVIDKYFSKENVSLGFFHQSEEEHSYLFTSMLRIVDNLSERQVQTAIDSSVFLAEIVFSESRLYDEDTGKPFDPDHFKSQQRIIQMLDDMPEKLAVYFVGMDDEEDNQDDPGVNIEKLLCKATGGKCLNTVDWFTLLNDIRERFGINTVDFQVTLDNPGSRYYFGKHSTIGLKFSTFPGDSEIVAVYRDYALGTVYEPIATGSTTKQYILFRGIVLAIVISIMVFLIFQFLVPNIRYRIFRYKYVREYTGPNMTVGKVMVPNQCYMCKAPFAPGDKIVAKCAHVVHEECWEENDGQCPEHGGGQCTEGSFFYDRNRLLNHRNAPWFMNWVLLAIFAATLSWSIFLMWSHVSFCGFIDGIADFLTGRMSVDGGGVFFDVRQYYISMFGCHVALILTSLLSCFTVYKRKWPLFAAEVLIRGIVAGYVVLFIFVSRFCIVFASQIFTGMVFFTWIAWALTAMCIVFCCTFRTRVKLKVNRYFYTAVVGVVSSFFWQLCSGFDVYDDFLFIYSAYLVLSLGITLLVAQPAHKMGRAYLHLSGYIKDMDVALYKWFAQNQKTVVSIGASVDCSIHMNWELMSHIAPVQAKIRIINGTPYLFSVDGDVFLNDKLLRDAHLYKLYHGDTFVIGRTNFRYIEI